MNSFVLSKPQRRKRVFAKNTSPFPIPIESQTGATSGGEWWYYTAYIVNGRILVQHSGDMEQLYKLGFFGKGTLSKHRPHFERFDPVIHRTDPDSGKQRSLKVNSKRKYLRHRAWSTVGDETSPLDEDHGLPRTKKKSDLTDGIRVGSCHDEEDVEPPSKKGRLADSETGDTSPSCSFDGRQTVEESMDVHTKKSASSTWSPGVDPWSSDLSSQLKQDDDPWALPTDTETAMKDPWAESTTEESAQVWGVSEVTQQESTQKDMMDVPASQSPSRNLESKDLDHLEPTDGTECDKPSSADARESANVFECIEQKTVTAEEPKTKDTNLNKMNIDSIGDTPRNMIKLDPRCASEDEDADWLVRDDTDDSDIDDSAESRTIWQPVAKKNPCIINESLQLSMEEAFFLSYALGCLIIYDENKVALDLSCLWRRFCDKDPRFIWRYCVYHNLRSKGWVPKSGLKYGSDFVVYKQGPAFYHSSYSVIVQHYSGHDLQPSKDEIPRAQTWTEIAAINRMAEQVSKEVMFCYVIEPHDMTDEDKRSPNCLKRLQVQELVLRRCVSKHERENMEYYLIP